MVPPDPGPSDTSTTSPPVPTVLFVNVTESDPPFTNALPFQYRYSNGCVAPADVVPVLLGVTNPSVFDGLKNLLRIDCVSKSKNVL